jgi:hypothetical protein
MFDFNDTIGNISNPLIFTGDKWPTTSVITFSATVFDVDEYSDDDYIDIIRGDIVQVGFVRSAKLTGQSFTNSIELILSANISCDHHYYGSQCQIYCQPQDDDINGHFTCDEEGEIVCRSGYQMPQTNCTTPICQPSCNSSNGYCISPNTCQCEYGWTGSTCDEICTDCFITSTTISSNGNASPSFIPIDSQASSVATPVAVVAVILFIILLVVIVSILLTVLIVCKKKNLQSQNVTKASAGSFSLEDDYYSSVTHVEDHLTNHYHLVQEDAIGSLKNLENPLYDSNAMRRKQSISDKIPQSNEMVLTNETELYSDKNEISVGIYDLAEACGDLPSPYEAAHPYEISNIASPYEIAVAYEEFNQDLYDDGDSPYSEVNPHQKLTNPDQSAVNGNIATNRYEFHPDFVNNNNN